MAKTLSDIPIDTGQTASASLKAAPFQMPLGSTMEVIPTCTKDRNPLGFSSSGGTAREPRPLRTQGSDRALRQ